MALQRQCTFPIPEATKNKMIETEVVVVGKGIAALVLSVLLKRAGIKHLLLDRVGIREKPALAETLPPTTLPLLQKLGLKAVFEQFATKTFGYNARWGTDRIVNNDFFFHRTCKNGLKLDKRALLAALEKQAEKHILPYSTLLDISNDGTASKVHLKTTAGSPSTVKANIIVDATGRKRAILKKMNIASIAHDETLAFSCHLPYKKLPELRHPVYVESFATGWGIVSSMEQSYNVMTLFSSPDNPVFHQFKAYENWKHLLAETNSLKSFLTSEVAMKVYGYQANSSRASQISGRNWLSIGDAAIAFDPISSHGISNAIYCADEASKAICSYLKHEKHDAFQEYAATLVQIFETYLQHKEALYRNEQRWPESEFWNKRAAVVTH